MTLNFLGRGSAFNIKEGNNSAYIKENNKLILLDCGESVFEKIVSKNLLEDIRDVHVLITHLDSDHVGSLSSLIYYTRYIKQIVSNVYFPDSDLYNLLKIQGHMEGQDYRFNYIDIDTNTSSEFGNIRPIKVEHIETLNCFGYLLYVKGKLIWYSGDCKNVSNIINEYEIDEFYQDTCLADYEGNIHTSLRILCETIPKHKRSKIYCMHIDCEELIKKAKHEGFNVVEIN
ncbi:MBL fold metallo-hydrolase [Clostridium kluyveri]|uniref:Predicted hydrolase n=2 Tax=Clostridium kluyveri TaxID=1534 RepID=A5N5H2_CLOK5|nr:MBL fold metallo-hydrolase [Clostridium kluyveri]EDK32553.1 Predicted hydrolase [Clostridium kluyveri DSM 555]BAH05488.1 hypothetical protein CKR_0437 [Clostridium kluyveri NBRC 12016]